MRQIERILPCFGVTEPIPEWRSQFYVRCPAHEGHSTSLALGEGADGRVLLHCFSGCPVEEILEAVDLTTRDLFPPGKQLGSRHKKGRPARRAAPPKREAIRRQPHHVRPYVEAAKLRVPNTGGTCETYTNDRNRVSRPGEPLVVDIFPPGARPAPVMEKSDDQPLRFERMINARVGKFAHDGVPEFRL